MFPYMTMHRSLALLGGMLLAAGLAAPQSHAGKADSPDLKEIRDYRLNMDVIQRYVAAFKKMSTDPAAKKCLDNNTSGNAQTLDASEKNLNTCPAAIADIKAAGMKPREFLIVTGALIGDVMAVSMKKSGTIKQYPDTLSPENAVFIEQNYDKIQAMMAPLGGAGK
jgi:hypothetical protein